MGSLVDALIMDANKMELEKVVKRHVVLGKITDSDLTEGELTLGTLNGDKIVISRGPANEVIVKFNDVMAKYHAHGVPDDEVSNGVIHVIDKVLVDPWTTTTKLEVTTEGGPE